MNQHLLTAQQAIARQDFSTAIDSFTQLIKDLPHAKLQIPLLSRAICYSQIKDHHQCIKDCERVLGMEDCTSPNELLPGCYSTKLAALTLLGQAYDKLGNKEQRDKYRKMATESLKTQGVKFEKATELKEKGNEIYRSGDYEGALTIYKEAFKIDPSSSVIASNICQCLLNLKRHLEAEEYANECVKLAPTWGKAWYRKGMVCLKRHAYMEATAAFQTGLKHDPENANLKSLYVEASRLAEKHTKGGFDKKMILMLMELKRESWKVEEWSRKMEKHLSFVPIGYPSAEEIQDYWKSELLPLYKQDKLASFIDRIKAYRRGKETSKYALEDMRSVLFADSPLISLFLLYKLVSIKEEGWSMVWSFQINKNVMEHPLFINDTENSDKRSKKFNLLYSSALYPYLTRHGCYAVLINKTRKCVFDFMHLWAILDAKEHKLKPNESFYQGYWYKSLLLGWNAGMSANENIYACQDEKKFEEFLERFMAEDQAPLASPTQPTPRVSVLENHDLSSPPASPVQEKREELEDEEEEEVDDEMPIKQTQSWIDQGGLLTQITGFLVAILSLLVYLYISGFGSD